MFQIFLNAPIALNMLLEMLTHSCFQISYHKISVFFIKVSEQNFHFEMQSPGVQTF